MLFAFSKRENIRKVAARWLILAQSEDFTREQEQRFLEWLSASPLHQAAYIEAEDIWTNGPSRVRAQNANPSRKTAWSVFSQWQAVSAFASVAFMLVGAWLYLSPPVGEEAYYQTAVGEQLDVLLSDGSKLSLNTDSAIQIKFDRSSRVVVLERGEVFFDVESMPKRPFDVRTARGKVRVLGTQFNVNANAQVTVVTVVHGRVALDAGNQHPDATFTADATLVANQQLSMHNAEANVKPLVVNVSNALAWRSSRLVFKGRALQEVINELNRYYDTPIMLGDDQLENRNVIAVIQLGDIDTVIATLEYTSQLRSERRDDGSIVLFSK